MRIYLPLPAKVATLTIFVASILTLNNCKTTIISPEQGKDPNEKPSKLGYFEIPKIEKPTSNTVFVRAQLPEAEKSKMRNYSMLYDTELKVAYWVAYPLHASYLGNAKRTDAWAYDPEFSTNEQATLFSGYGTGLGYDRGHQMPSADRNYSTAGNKTTFYFTNMTPQVSSLNQGVWATLETKVRTWTAQCDTMYVVTGAMVTSPTDKKIKYILDNNKKNVAIPKYYYKALAMKKGNQYYTIAYKMDNEKPKSSAFKSYQIDVAALEEMTGFTFFPQLTKAQKSEIDSSIWK